MPEYYEKINNKDGLMIHLFYNDETTVVRPHYHSNLEIILVKNGILILFVNGDYIVLKKDQFVIIPSNLIHFIVPSSVNEYITYHISKEGMSNQSELLNVFVGIHIPIVSEKIKSEHSKKIVGKLNNIHNEIKSKEQYSKVMVETYVNQLFVFLGRKLVSYDDLFYSNYEEYPTYIIKSIDFIDKNYRENICLGDVCTYVGLSKSHLSKKINKYLGVSFSDYLNTYRVNRAKFLLLSSNESVESIGYMVGYKYPQNFYRVFKKLTGLSPFKYKENVKNELEYEMFDET